MVNRTPKALVLGILVSILPATLRASEKERLYRSAYYLGRGDTGIAVADNHEAIHYNPAGIAQGKGLYKETVLVSPMVELSTATKDLIRKFALEESADAETLAGEMGKNQHLGVYNFTGIVFRRAALGATVSNQVNLLPRLSAEQRAMPVVGANAVTNQVMHFSLAEQFFSPQFSMGTTIKYISRSTAALDVALAEASEIGDRLGKERILNSGFGTGADFGMMYRGADKRSPVSFGLTVENAGGISLKGATPEDKPEDLHQTINLGFAIEPGTQFSRFKLLFDVRDIAGETEKNDLKKFHVGTELAIRQFTGVTAGLNHGYPSVGMYVNLYVLRLDVGSYTEEMGERIGERPDTRFYFRLMAGF